jgi:hypothetical protein
VRMYTLLVCADLYGEKVNLELTFSAMPTMGELTRKITETYNSEAQAKRPQGYPAIDFQIARLQIYDDVLLKWTDLVTCTQLHEYDQLYAFQPQSPWHIDVQKDLPPPRPPTIHSAVGGGSAVRPAAAPSAAHYEAQPYGASPARPAMTSGGGYTNGSAAYSAPPPSGTRRSPNQDRLEQQRMREEQLRQELARVHEETARLEAAYNAERDDELRRQAEMEERAFQQREAEIQRQRAQLQQAEEEYRRMMERRGAGGATPNSTSRPLY